MADAGGLAQIRRELVGIDEGVKEAKKDIGTFKDEAKASFDNLDEKVDANEKRIKKLQGSSDEKTGIAGLRQMVEANQAAIEANQAAIKDSQAAIEGLRGSSEDKTGIAGLRQMGEATQAALAGLGPGPGGLVTEADLKDLENRLVREDQLKAQWYRDYRVAFGALAVAALMALFDLARFLNGLRIPEG